MSSHPTVKKLALDIAKSLGAQGGRVAEVWEKSIERETHFSELVNAAKAMMREWIEEFGYESQNSTPGDTLEKLRSLLTKLEVKP